MTFKPYPKYKASGVEWLGDVPAHWQKTSLQDCAKTDRYSFVDGPFGSDLKNEEYVDDGVPLIQLNNIGVGCHNLEKLKFVTTAKAAELRKHSALAGDIVIAKMAAPVARAAVVDARFPLYVIVADCIKLAVDAKKYDLRFIQYWINSPIANAIAESKSSGITRVRINLGAVKKLPLFRIPLGEQATIANFLDREIAKIDTLITKQETMIELLKEKRLAIVSHGVTKGLDPNVPMKACGIPEIWINEVPAHWEVIRIKWIARMESGHTPDKKIQEYWENCEIPWVSLNDTGYLKDHDYISETAFQINELGIANSSARLLPAKTVVFSRDATIGRCAITTRPMAVSQHFIAWICGDRILPEFLLRSLRSMTQELNKFTTGATLKTIGMSDVKTLRCALPPLSEQVRIVEFIDEAIHKVDTLIAKAQHAIAVQKEHRTALISEAVTGKIDVRNRVDEKKVA